MHSKQNITLINYQIKNKNTIIILYVLYIFQHIYIIINYIYK